MQQQHQQRMKQAAAAAAAAAAQQQQQLMQQALLMQHAAQQQPPMFPGHHPHPGLLAAPQIEPIVSGNLPPGFDSSTCRSVYVGNIHLQVTDTLLQEVFQSIGPVEGCKLIRKEKSSFGFIDYYDHRFASLAIATLNGRQLFGLPIKVNWAYTSTQREDTSGHFNIFVGDLCPEVTDAALFAFFSGYSTCSDARVMWDQKTGRSRGFGFVSFRNQQDAQNAINDLNGKWLGNRQIRCNWATKGANAGEEKQTVDSKVGLTNGSSEAGKDNASEDGPENNPQFTTVYVGNLPHEANSNDVHRFFHSLGAGSIEEVRVTRDKGFGFVRFSTHEEAALAIQMGNGQVIGGRQIKCSWGSKPTPPGTSSAPLPPPAPAPFPAGVSATDLLAYQRTVALSKMAANPALMGQHALKQAAWGMDAGASLAIYDGGFQGVNANAAATQQQQQQQQLMYY
ncbi:oligouridylate-binding protein 1B-like isoform X2 [Phragmites australis]|uniref:oligouridylate-binding protein 1B-like isoform X2 n=1 Tax=Phragmites australis TaxID=29695 RepID=UPI002D767900|nr:oligouridylate-binding protein 1B-like isoform X2 [Phragmites australis]